MTVDFAILGCGNSAPLGHVPTSLSASISHSPTTRTMLGSNINVGNTSSLGPVAGKKPKVALKPGRSLMDWIRLGASGKDLQGFGGHLRTVSMEELAKHNTENDCWMLLRGKQNTLFFRSPGAVPR